MKLFTLLAMFLITSQVFSQSEPRECEYKNLGTNKGCEDLAGLGCYESEQQEDSDEDDDKLFNKLFGNKQNGQWCERDNACLSGRCEKIVIEHHKNNDGEEDHGTDHDKCKWRKRCVPYAICRQAPPGEKAPGSIKCDNTSNPFIVKNSQEICEPKWDQELDPSSALFNNLGIIGSVTDSGGACALKLEQPATENYLTNFLKISAFEHLFNWPDSSGNFGCMAMELRANQAARGLKAERDSAAVTFSKNYQEGYLKVLQEVNASQDSWKLQCLPIKALKTENLIQMELNKNLITALANFQKHIRYMRDNYNWKGVMGKQWRNPFAAAIDTNNSQSRKHAWTDDEPSWFGVPVQKYECRRRNYVQHMSHAWMYRMKLNKHAMEALDGDIKWSTKKRDSKGNVIDADGNKVSESGKPAAMEEVAISKIYGNEDDKAALIDPFFPFHSGIKNFEEKQEDPVQYCGKEKYRRRCNKEDMKQIYSAFKDATPKYFIGPAVDTSKFFQSTGVVDADSVDKAFIQSTSRQGLGFLGINLNSDPNGELSKLLTDETLRAFLDWSYSSRKRHGGATAAGATMAGLGLAASSGVASVVQTAAMVGMAAGSGAAVAGAAAGGGAVIGLALLYQSTLSPNARRYLFHYLSNRVEYLNQLELSAVSMITYLTLVNKLRAQLASCHIQAYERMRDICNPEGNTFSGTNYENGGDPQNVGATGQIKQNKNQVKPLSSLNNIGKLNLNSAAIKDLKNYGEIYGDPTGKAFLGDSLADQLASDLKKRFENSIAKLNDQDKAFAKDYSKAARESFLSFTANPFAANSSAKTPPNKAGAVGIVGSPQKEEKKGGAPVASAKPAAKSSSSSSSPKFDFGLDKDSSRSSNTNEATNHEETDAMLSETKSDKYKPDENDDLFTTISKTYVREGFPRLLKRKSSLEKVESKKETNQGLDKIQDLE